MPLVEPITSYDVKRRRARPRVLPPMQMAYCARIGDGPIVKIGRTGNIEKRAEGHASATGQTSRFLVQLIVASREIAKDIERHMLHYARERFEPIKREWFVMTDRDVADMVADAWAFAADRVIEQRGDPGAVDEPEPAFMADHRAGRQIARQYNRMHHSV
jgi:hypothetical protein